MANQPAAFEIDDDKSVDENIAAFIAELKSIDADLAAVLDPFMSDCSRGKPLDNDALLGALFAATAPAGDDAQ